MRNKDYRELQISSSQLVVIFLAIIVLGIVIFLLGVSVGKKHTQIAAKSQIPEKITTEMITAQTPKTVETAKTAITEELESHQKSETVPPPAPEPAEKKPPAVQEENLYYIQIGAYQNRDAANSLAESIRKSGYPALVQAPRPNAAKQLYQVRVGGYQTRDQAESEKTRLINAGLTKNKDYFIVRN